MDKDELVGWPREGLTIALADELFECTQGNFASYHSDAFGFHPYRVFQLGGYDTPAPQKLVEAFEGTLRQLRVRAEGLDRIYRNEVGKPFLYWRFAVPHVFLEGDPNGRCQLYTRLAIRGFEDRDYDWLRIVPSRGR